MVAAAQSADEIAFEKIAFEAFVKNYGKTYATPEERAERFETFKENLEYIHQQNAQGSTKYAPNAFTDMKWTEFRADYVGGVEAPAPSDVWGGLPYLGAYQKTNVTLPASIDWMAKGAVTPVKNQGSCGSCWSFATTGSLEGAAQIATGKLVSMSEQQFVDCSIANHACKGGIMDTAYEYAEKHAICTEESYPYKAEQGECMDDTHHGKTCVVALKAHEITGFHDVDPGDEQAMMEAVAMGPVAVAIEADQKPFQFYDGGVVVAECGHKLDHGVLVIGYGTDTKNGTETKYWTIKNSWGPAWGEGGLIRIKRGESLDGPTGECGVLSMPTYPKVSVPTEALNIMV